MLTAPFQIAYLCVLIEISHWLAQTHLASSGASTEALPPSLMLHHTIHIYMCLYVHASCSQKGAKTDQLCYLQSIFSRGISFLKTLYEFPLIARVLFFLKWRQKVNISSLFTSENDTMFSSCLWRWIFCSLTGPMELLASLKPTPEDSGSTQITSNNYLPQKLSESSGGVASWFNTFAPLKNSIVLSEYWLYCFRIRVYVSGREDRTTVYCVRRQHILQKVRNQV